MVGINMEIPTTRISLVKYNERVEKKKSKLVWHLPIFCPISVVLVEFMNKT